MVSLGGLSTIILPDEKFDVSKCNCLVLMTTLVGNKVLENMDDEVVNDSVCHLSTTVDGRIDLFGHAGQAAMYREFRPQYSKQMVESVVSRIADSDRGLCVDIACGPGTLTELVAPYFSKTLGIDQSIEAIFETDTLNAFVGGGLHDRPNHGIEARGIPAAREYADAFDSLGHLVNCSIGISTHCFEEMPRVRICS